MTPLPACLANQYTPPGWLLHSYFHPKSQTPLVYPSPHSRDCWQPQLMPHPRSGDNECWILVKIMQSKLHYTVWHRMLKYLRKAKSQLNKFHFEETCVCETWTLNGSHQQNIFHWAVSQKAWPANYKISLWGKKYYCWGSVIMLIY